MSMMEIKFYCLILAEQPVMETVIEIILFSEIHSMSKRQTIKSKIFHKVTTTDKINAHELPKLRNLPRIIRELRKERNATDRTSTMDVCGVFRK